jgi:hypothetical protein
MRLWRDRFDKYFLVLFINLKMSSVGLLVVKEGFKEIMFHAPFI